MQLDDSAEERRRPVYRRRSGKAVAPDGIQPDISDSQAVVDHLGIRYYTVNIGEAVKALKKSIEVGKN